MRIAIFGNTNNALFVLANALRGLGHTVDLIVNQPVLLHRPENIDSALQGSYPSWIYDCSHIDESDFISQSLRITPVLKLMNEADGLILNHLGPSLFSLLERRPTISYLTGSDLDYLANIATVDVREERWSPEFRKSAAGIREHNIWTRFIENQRIGILASDFVSYFPRGFIPTGDVLLDDIGVEDSQRFTNYFGDVTPSEYVPPPVHSTIRVFCGARITWMKPRARGTGDLDYKGTDILLEGFSRFCREESCPIELRLVEKGLHVEETKRLIAKMGLESRVVWLREMNRGAFYEELVSADVCVDQLGSSAVGMAGIDAMAVGRPLIAKGHIAEWKAMLGSEPPICDADTPDAVCEQLKRLVFDKSERLRIGEASWRFVSKHWSAGASAKACAERLTSPNAKKGLMRHYVFR